MRHKILSELIKDLLGPSQGRLEKIGSKDHTPLDEYMTGVLAPKGEKQLRDPDQEADLPPEYTEGDTALELDDTFDLRTSSIVPTKILDPKRRPNSIGLSFNVKTESENPMINLCLTWARYFFDNDEWNRHPRYYIKTNVSCQENQTIFIDKDGETSNPTSAEISLTIYKRPISKGSFHISVYIVNEIKQSNQSFSKVEEHIFQPQIRVRCVDCKIEPLKKRYPLNPDEEELDYIYRERGILARGHLCSAIWAQIDPERPPEKTAIYREPPFYWLDGESIPLPQRKEFVQPDVRTEFLPIIPIESPKYEWDTQKWGEKGELSAEILSRTWEPDEIKAHLLPLVLSYKKWIDSLKSLINPSDSKFKIVNRLVQKCNQIQTRITEGIEFLARDETARIAFCFANKAIDTQYKWKTKQTKSLHWRPFQLAFILLAIESVANPQSPNREKLELLYVPTGAGKTEAYLAIAAFAIAYRRRKALQGNDIERTGGGVSVIMRYTLRLLTIQQFRRALRLVTACEYLRVYNLASGNKIGWRPEKSGITSDFIWGMTKFTIGLWIGGKVAPNWILKSSTPRKTIPGAIELLERKMKGEGEPAQVLTCPACEHILSAPETGLQLNKYHWFHFIIKTNTATSQLQKALNMFTMSGSYISLRTKNLTTHLNGYYTISLEAISNQRLTPSRIFFLWKSLQDFLKKSSISVNFVAAHPSRPGYFIKRYISSKGIPIPFNFEIICPNPKCPLNSSDILWTEGRPIGETFSKHITIHNRRYTSTQDLVFVEVPEFTKSSSDFVSNRIPIPALTIDEQVYSHPPSFIIGTVDKVARIPFEPRSSSIFGNVEFYHRIFGYYREGVPQKASMSRGKHPSRNSSHRKAVTPFEPPDLIIQDELHLIEGPLGSMVGIYETAVDYLCSKGQIKPKYIASTATVCGADTQVNSLYLRELCVFPPHGVKAEDRFFILHRNPHPLDEKPAGKLYVGICAPGLGPLTPMARIWSRLLQTVYEIATTHAVDPFWTLVGYFNAIRELAGVRALYRQDIPGRMKRINPTDSRPLPVERAIELSSQTNSLELPVVISQLESKFSGNRKTPEAFDALFTTSMFGTGVDISRLSLMVVAGQPKTTSSYIQSTGRVGRRTGGLVATFYRATRPRDLSHYEMFCGYHQNLERFIEPITAAPFAPGTLIRCIGPVLVGILRNAILTSSKWHTAGSASEMSRHRRNPDVVVIPSIFESRAQKQPRTRTPNAGEVEKLVESEIDKWRSIAQLHNDLKYVEYILAVKPVVLGDPQHKHAGCPIVFNNAPQSLRDIEETTGFEI